MKEKILAMLEKELPEIDFREDVALVDDGIIDSFTLAVIITNLSIEFDITIPQEEIIEDNFNSVDSMVELVKRLKSN